MEIEMVEESKVIPKLEKVRITPSNGKYIIELVVKSGWLCDKLFGKSIAYINRDGEVTFEFFKAKKFKHKKSARKGVKLFMKRVTY